VKIKPFVATLVFMLVCAAIASGQGQMSPAFREQGRRALDAIRRLPSIPSKEHQEPGLEQRKLDAEKAIAEAKYKARTVKDKEVLKLLQAANLMIGAALRTSELDPDWAPLNDASVQCKVEIIAAVDPIGELSALGRKKAAEKTCLKQKDAILKKWEAIRP
jgi:hypothetical protein